MDHNRDNNRGRNYGRDSERDYDGDRRHSSYSTNGNHSNNYHSNNNNSAGRGGRGFGNGNGNGNGNGGAGYGRGGGGFNGRGNGGRGNGGAMNGGGRGNNRHMGEHPAIQNLLRTYDSQLNDAACLPIIDSVDTDRETRVCGTGNDTRSLPVLAVWRYADPVGLQLDKLKESSGDRNIVRSNYFRVPARKIPAVIHHYNVVIFKYKMIDGEVVLDADPEDISQGSDKLAVSGVMNNLLRKHCACWDDVGTAHNGASSLFTTQRLALPLLDSDAARVPLVPEGTATTTDYPAEYMYESDVFLSSNGAFSPRPFFKVVMRYTGVVRTPLPQWSNTTTDFVPADSSESREALHAMDVALLSFARKQLATGQWILSGNKVFSPSESKQYVLNERFVGMLGYHASFRACLSGLALVKDISVTCFLKGGNLADFVAAALGCRGGPADLPYEMRLGNPRVASLVDLLKNCKLRVLHLNMTKKFRSFSHAANSRDSAFETDPSAVPTTVADYFLSKYGLRLKYPGIPTVDVGSRNRPILMPMEQLVIVQGQTRQRSITGDVSAQIIKHAAMLPNDRFKELTQTSFLFPALENDFDAQAFGIANITAQTGAQAGTAALPMKVKGTILPPAKLQYANNRKVEPELKGAWNLAGGLQFSHKPPKPQQSYSGRGGNVYPYAGLLVHQGLGRSSPQEVMQTLQGLLGRLEGESRVLGIPLELVQQAVVIDLRDLGRALSDCKARGARIVVVVMLDEVLYAGVKRVADGMCLPTQCARYIKVVKCIRNYETNLLIKMNMKLGGTNHTLAARRGLKPDEDADYIYQKPPHSISWLFNEPTMVMGIDVNHPSPGEQKSSVVAVVASMDGMLGQYCTYITDCSAGYEPVSSLYQSFKALLRTFCARNAGSFPRNIIVYRDGVADSQFMDTLTTELGQLREAVNSFEYDEDYVKISFVVCQKRHQTRFFFQPAPGEDYMNPCVGLCVDSCGFGPDAANPATAPRYDQATGADALGCIMGVNRNEFYLNSHAAVLGTSKPTKYILLHDEIGFKMSELQLLTFWLTHLYGRCTRSVSIVAPAYYAHWAARRGKALLQAGVAPEHLKTLSAEWLADSETPAMYFI